MHRLAPFLVVGLAGCATTATAPVREAEPEPQPEIIETSTALGPKRPHLSATPIRVRDLPIAKRIAAGAPIQPIDVEPIVVPQTGAKSRGVTVAALAQHRSFGMAQVGPWFGYSSPGGEIPIEHVFLPCTKGLTASYDASWSSLSAADGQLAVTLMSGHFRESPCEVDIETSERVVLRPLVPELSVHAFRTSDLRELVVIMPRMELVTSDSDIRRGSFTEIRFSLATGGSMMGELRSGAVAGFERILSLQRSTPSEGTVVSIGFEVVPNGDDPRATLYSDLNE